VRTPLRASASEDSLTGVLSEKYLQGRALLSSFMVRTGSRGDLDRAHALLKNVTLGVARFAPAWTGLGIAELQYARHGFGGQIHVMRARRAFDEALKLDPASTEANLYRIYMLLSRGEKESARHGIANLLAGAANDWNVHMVAGIALRGDGMYEEALAHFGRALKLNPRVRPFSITIGPAFITIKTRLSLPATNWRKAWLLSPGIRCCARRPGTRRCGLDIWIRRSRFLRA